MEIEQIIEEQRKFFATGKTIDVEYRVEKLKQLKEVIARRENDIHAAVKADLGKSAMESYMCEVGLVMAELGYQISHVRKWAKPQHVMADLTNFHSKYFTIAEPYGVTLIMSPWNYPFMLTLDPLVGSVAAGNCCVLKPSAYSPATSAIINEIVEEVFEPGHVACVQGGRAENTKLLDQRWDHIFFTGSVAVGKTVMEKASRNLTPVVLELGGKSPCIIAKDANIKIAASRLAFGKYLNLGQTCVAPDYVLVDESIHDVFLAEFKKQVAAMYGADAFQNPDYGKMVNEKHFDRVNGLIEAFAAAHGADKVFGGRSNRETLQIEPTILDGAVGDDAVMGEEIFGPVCPILTYKTVDEAEAFIKNREKPLALYLFSDDRALQQRILRHVPFGGGCLNDTIVHLATSAMGFGGVGNSGMGSYHGELSFKTFSHTKSILKKYKWIDVPVRNQPYSPLKAKLLRFLLH